MTSQATPPAEASWALSQVQEFQQPGSAIQDWAAVCFLLEA